MLLWRWWCSGVSARTGASDPGHGQALRQLALSPARLPQQPPALAPQTFIPLPVGSITPRGWLLEQLKLQAEGLSGHLAMFYPSIGNSWWVGGTDDQGGWIYQQAPYWCVALPPSLAARRAAAH